MRNIELMVIGAQKAGTTSLSNYLGEHPSLLNPLCMEFTWFNQAGETTEGLGAFMARYYPAVTESSIRYIAKMSNLYRYRARLAALYEHFPNCQLALVVRDPVQRAYSAYRMACFDGWMTFDPGYMAELLRTGKPGDMLYDRFVGYGLYAEALEEVWSIFPREQVHVFRFEDLKRDMGLSAARFVWFAAPLTVIIALLMFSNFRYYSFKTLPQREDGKVAFKWIAIPMLALVTIALAPPQAMLAIGLIYVVSGPVMTLLLRRRLQDRRAVVKAENK